MIKPSHLRHAALTSLIASACAATPPVDPIPSSPIPVTAESATTAPATVSTLDDAPRGQRVGGDETIQVEVERGEWCVGPMRIEAPLPKGYPAPTPPGAIEIKTYPSVRRAEYQGRGETRFGMNVGFWPLFQHIQRRDIAMTSPVEMDYPKWDGDAETAPPEWTMSFLYRTSDLGPTGEDGRIRIVDTDPLTVIAIGLRGPYGLDRVAAGLEALEAWLTGSTEWVAAGAPRAFYYNGPQIRNADKWAEAQIPVAPRAAAPPAAGAEPTAPPVDG